MSTVHIPYTYPNFDPIHIPRNIPEFTLTDEDFSAVIPNLNELKRQIRTAPHTPGIHVSSSFRCGITPSAITDDNMKLLHKNITTRCPVFRILYLLLKSGGDRIRHHTKERDCFMVWCGQGWSPFSGSSGYGSTAQVVHHLSEGMLFIHSLHH